MGDRDRRLAGALSRRQLLARTAALGGAAATVWRLGPGGVLAQEEPLGSQLIGKLEGPDRAGRCPAAGQACKQAPMLADLVQARHVAAGRAARAGGAAGHQAARRGSASTAAPAARLHRARRRRERQPLRLRRQARLLGLHRHRVPPGPRQSWEFSDDDRVLTIHLRKGHKWSDGAPFTADDFVFWYEDIYLNKDLVPTPHASFAINGKQGRIEKVDETTVRFVFEEPYPLFLTILGGTTFMGSGHMTNRGFHGGAYAPAHYLKQFLPKYTPQADLDRLATGERRGLDRPVPPQEPVVLEPRPADPRSLAHRPRRSTPRTG